MQAAKSALEIGWDNAVITDKNFNIFQHDQTGDFVELVKFKNNVLIANFRR